MLRTRPGLRRLWRDVGRVQLGDDPAHAVVLDGLGPVEEALLDELAVGVEVPDLRTRYPDRGGSPGAPAAVTHLLALLRTADALEPPPAQGARSRAGAGPAEAAALGLVRGGSGWDVLSRRAEVVVRVEGASRAAVAVAAGLLEAGVGTVDLAAGNGTVRPADVALGGLAAQDVGSPADAATARVLGRWRQHLALRPTAPHGGTGGSAHGCAPVPALTVLVASGAVAPRRAAELVRHDAAHLAVVVRVRTAVVGPLVLPGRGPCLRCVDLHRGERDPEWPRVAAQLAHPAAPPGAGAVGEDVVLVRLTAALAVSRALAFVDDVTGSLAVTTTEPGTQWELDLADGLPRGRRWQAHPRCGCTWPPG